MAKVIEKNLLWLRKYSDARAVSERLARRIEPLFVHVIDEVNAPANIWLPLSKACRKLDIRFREKRGRHLTAARVMLATNQLIADLGRCELRHIGIGEIQFVGDAASTFRTDVERSQT